MRARTATPARVRASQPSATFAQVWRLFDARGKVLGRLASEIATVLMGKHKPIYHPAGARGIKGHRGGEKGCLARRGGRSPVCASDGRCEGTARGTHGATHAADLGDYVVVVNAKEVRVTGRKAEQKLYRHHTQYVGGLKEIPFERMMERAPEKVRRRPAP